MKTMNSMHGPGCWLHLKSRDCPTLKLWSGPSQCHKASCTIITVMSFQPARLTHALQLTAGNTFPDEIAFSRAYIIADTLHRRRLAQRHIQRVIDGISTRTSQIKLKIAVKYT